MSYYVNKSMAKNFHILKDLLFLIYRRKRNNFSRQADKVN